MENINDYRVKIVTGQYRMAPSEQKQMIQELFGEDAEYNYEIYFHYSIFKIKTHNAYIIMKIPKESYIKEKES